VGTAPVLYSGNTSGRKQPPAAVRSGCGPVALRRQTQERRAGTDQRRCLCCAACTVALLPCAARPRSERRAGTDQRRRLRCAAYTIALLPCAAYCCPLRCLYYCPVARDRSGRGAAAPRSQIPFHGPAVRPRKWLTRIEARVRNSCDGLASQAADWAGRLMPKIAANGVMRLGVRGAPQTPALEAPQAPTLETPQAPVLVRASVQSLRRALL
jgi:hypothetical protein